MTTTGEADAPSEWVRVGQHLRQAREAAGISVRELARRVDVSPGHVSNVERGLASLSVRSLYSIVSELGVSMDSLFAPVGADVPTTGHAMAVADRTTIVPPGGSVFADRPLEGGGLESKGIVLRQDRRPSIPLPSGTRWERLSPQPEVGGEFIEVVYPPADHASAPDEFTMHSSREYGVITHGALTVQVGFDVAVLHEGDSIVFNSTTPHRFWNATASEVRAIWFIWDDYMTSDSHLGARESGADGDVRLPPR